MTPKIVVFDWGGVILRIVRSFEEGCQRAGLPVHAEAGAQTLRDLRSALAQEFQKGTITEDEFYAEVAKLTAGKYSAKEFQLIHDAWLIAEYPGVAQLIHDIHGAGVATTGLLSNTNHRHWMRHLPRDGTPGDFPTIGLLRHKHASHLMGLAKPDLAIFRRFEDLSGFQRSDILFFDDLSENVEAARQIGWHAIQIDHQGDTASQMRAELLKRQVLPQQPTD
ncbi:MAG: HAD family phosphatase [Planctomycetes bacterium]|nr:HAD family phosphatase [Planctomycetota bacterium]